MEILRGHWIVDGDDAKVRKRSFWDARARGRVVGRERRCSIVKEERIVTGDMVDDV